MQISVYEREISACQVDQFLQVGGHSNWFAIGDITNLPDDRLGRLAAEQGGLLGANLKAAFSGTGKKAKVSIALETADIQQASN